MLKFIPGDILAVRDALYGLQDLQRVVFEVFDTHIEFALVRLKFPELPVADSEQRTIEENDLAEPVYSYVECLIVRQLLWRFVAILIVSTASVFEVHINTMCPVADSREKFVSEWVDTSWFEAGDEDFVDGPEWGSHNNDHKGHYGHWHDGEQFLRERKVCSSLWKIINT